MYKNKEFFQKSLIRKLETNQGKSLDESSANDIYLALSALIREHISAKWVQTNNHYRDSNTKEVYYFSLEFLLGRMLGKNLLNLDLKDLCAEALEEMGLNLQEIEELEPDAGLGNGGLGRLAACFLDSLASSNFPGHGCGIRYKYGLFEQRIVDGYQVELPDNWLKDGNVWEIRKADKAIEVRFGGQVRIEEKNDRQIFILENYFPVLAVPYDTPILGYKNNTVNNLRLWSAEAVQQEFDLSLFNHGQYLQAMQDKYSAESISQILYPDDNHPDGMLLRLKQQYFFVSAGLQSIVRRFYKKEQNIAELSDKVAVHINDTHPALAIPELMRILIDDLELDWDQAWDITTKTISYTNHTILSEALEKWPASLLQELLPRIYMIIEEINRRFCLDLEKKQEATPEQIHEMAIIADGSIRMANLAVVGSYSVNGVAKIHTDILKKEVMKNFYNLYPYKFNNKTNGITHRRWLLKANPRLSNLITKTIGNSWTIHPIDLITLTCYADQIPFQDEVAKIKKANKEDLAKLIKNKYSLLVDPDSIFDVHVKRLHSYKRQILNILHIMHLYNTLKDNPNLDIVPRTFIFGAKAAPGYYLAKTTIKLINTVASVINQDKTINDKIKVVFLENYRVSLAEMIFPAADISEQISTAGKEASGTGNMKFMMNGAITLGTLDGANIEIKDEVGEENIFVFGLTASEVFDYYEHGGYNAWDIYHSDQRIKRVLDQLINGFLPGHSEEFRSLYDYLLTHNDEYFVLKDFASYLETQEKINQTYLDRKNWLKKSIINIGCSGKFSSDRTISEYAAGIWDIKPNQVPSSEKTYSIRVPLKRF